MSQIDLHVHSGYSDDGELSPAQLVARCQVQGIRLLSITDHNSVRGVAEAIAAAQDVQVLPGVELDCSYGGQFFHLLGYGFDYTQPAFAQLEQDILEQESRAGEERVALFRKATGLPISTREVLERAGDRIITGELIAELALEQSEGADCPLLAPYLPGGPKSDMPNVRIYWDFFAPGKVAYVPIHFITLPQAVSLLHGSGGRCILAHPGQNLGQDYQLLHQILDEGVDGVEAFSSYHTAAQAQAFAQLARERGLLVTAGSDFHGRHKPQIALGGHGATWPDQKLGFWNTLS